MFGFFPYATVPYSSLYYNVLLISSCIHVNSQKKYSCKSETSLIHIAIASNQLLKNIDLSLYLSYIYVNSQKIYNCESDTLLLYSATASNKLLQNIDLSLFTNTINTLESVSSASLTNFSTFNQNTSKTAVYLIDVKIDKGVC